MPQPQPHPQELAFHQAILENPIDEDLWLVLADWLEEHDDPRRAELLRLHRQVLATCWTRSKRSKRADWQARMVELLAAGVRPGVPQRTVLLGKRKEVPMTFSWIGPGSFLMGSPNNEEGRSEDETTHRVTLTKGFWLGVHPVTQRQWLSGMRRNPSRFKGEDRPVENVSWTTCHTFCRMLSERDGKQYRLPTEAEWEYACRAGTDTAYSSGNGPDAMRKVGWCSYDGEWESAKKTRPVGQFLPNAWGLYDMHGNVWEWCADGQREYSAKAITDPIGPQGEDHTRVLRGGSWAGAPNWCRSAHRSHDAPDYHSSSRGCRLALCPD